MFIVLDFIPRVRKVLEINAILKVNAYLNLGSQNRR
jgi:hypothetical protein